jgi:hypothetical protein
MKSHIWAGERRTFGAALVNAYGMQSWVVFENPIQSRRTAQGYSE